MATLVPGTPPLSFSSLFNGFIKTKVLQEDSINAFYTYQRHAIKDFLNYLSTNSLSSRTVYLNEIACHEVTKTIEKMGFKIVYVKSTKDFKICLKDLEEKLQNAQHSSILFLTHVYGKFSDLTQLNDLIINNNVIILEDFAHYPYRIYPLEKFQGDVLLYTYRKTFPVPLGAKIEIRNKKYLDFFSTSLKATNCPQKYYSQVSLLKWLMRNQLKKLFILFKINPKIPYRDLSQDPLPEIKRLQPPFIKLISKIVSTNADDFRRWNYDLFYNNLHDSLKPRILPYNLNVDIPFQVIIFLKKNESKINSIKKFRDLGIQATEGLALPKDVTIRIDEKDFQQHHICLPLSQHFSKTQILALSNSILTVFG